MHVICFFYTLPSSLMFFFFNYTASTEFYTLSLHDALPIYADVPVSSRRHSVAQELSRRDATAPCVIPVSKPDRKCTRLNSSHTVISYAVFCLKKKKN